jgi:hypothetical protein
LCLRKGFAIIIFIYITFCFKIIYGFIHLANYNYLFIFASLIAGLGRPQTRDRQQSSRVLPPLTPGSEMASPVSVLVFVLLPRVRLCPVVVSVVVLVFVIVQV